MFVSVGCGGKKSLIIMHRMVDGLRFCCVVPGQKGMAHRTAGNDSSAKLGASLDARAMRSQRTQSLAQAGLEQSPITAPNYADP